MSHASTCHAALRSKNAEIVRVLIEYQAQAKLVRPRVLRKTGHIWPPPRSRPTASEGSGLPDSPVSLRCVSIPRCGSAASSCPTATSSRYSSGTRRTGRRRPSRSAVTSATLGAPSGCRCVARPSRPAHACLSVSWVRGVSARKMLRAHPISHHRSAGSRTKRRGGRATAP